VVGVVLVGGVVVGGGLVGGGVVIGRPMESVSVIVVPFNWLPCGV